VRPGTIAIEAHSVGFSSANPWLDPLSAPEASKLAGELNEELEGYCASSPKSTFPGTEHLKRLYGLGLLPIVPQASLSDILGVITQIKNLPHLRGVIMGTRGLGKGLDDDRLEEIWEALAQSGLVVFLHPHYGVGGGSEWGPKENGHVLPLALGFPMETAIVGPLRLQTLADF
jgi:aminocarboxymuconate-semialdehyde decarboxylase